MKTTISAQQMAFYTKNGVIEFEQNLNEIYPIIREPGHDRWRKNLKMQNFLIKKLGPIALALSGKKQLHLGTDLLITAENRPKKAGLIKELFSIQGLAIAVAIAENPVPPAQRSHLGILPIPSEKETVLFFKPEFILDWPHVLSNVYIALFANINAVYIYNPHDPATNAFKQYGYNFGDCLKNEFHPLIIA